MAWDPKSEGIAQIDGALSFLKSVRFLFFTFKTNETIFIFWQLDWTEPWLYCLIGFYIFLGLFLVLTRKYSLIQSLTFIMLRKTYQFRFSKILIRVSFAVVTVYIAEDLNEYLAKNHKLFTKHQYFDSSGLFISLFMSTPLLLLCSFVVGNWFYQSSELMTQVKQLQVDRQMRKRQASEQKKNL